MLASQANAPVYITKVMSRSSADVVADSRRSGKCRSDVVRWSYSVTEVVTHTAKLMHLSTLPR